MKALKLIAIAIVLLAAIVGLLLLTESSSLNTVSGDKGRLMETMKAELLTDWHSTQQWDAAQFDNILDRLKQNRRELGDGYQTLVDLTGELACHRLDSLTMGEFAKADCSKAQIDIYANGLDHLLVKISHFKNNNDMKKMLGTVDIYRKACALGSRELGMSPQFNARTDRWNSFSNYSNGIKQQRKNIRDSEYFPYIKHITEVQEGLNNVDAKLAAARSRYKTRLAREIIKAYGQMDPKEPERLKQVSNRFKREMGSDTGLEAFVNNY